MLLAGQSVRAGPATGSGCGSSITAAPATGPAASSTTRPAYCVVGATLSCRWLPPATGTSGEVSTRDQPSLMIRTMCGLPGPSGVTTALPEASVSALRAKLRRSASTMTCAPAPGEPSAVLETATVIGRSSSTGEPALV